MVTMIKRPLRTLNKFSVFITILLTITLLTTQSFSADNDWFKALQNAINTPGPEKNTKLDHVLGMATKSGVQTYVIIQAAVAIDENAVGHVLQSATRVTNDPGGVVKAAILANISIPVVIKSVMASSPDKSTIISACIHSGEIGRASCRERVS
jgi:hypothetical protein